MKGRFHRRPRVKRVIWPVRFRQIAAAVLTACAIALLAACARTPIREERIVYGEQSLGQRALHTVEGRAIWVTRWDYTTAEDVERIVDNCCDARFNIIFFQVRGNATVFYRSELEPWAWELTSGGPETTGQDPGFDPLAVAIERAHKRGIELHAYMNVFPAWRSQNYPPENSGQLWVRHPEWFMVDRGGRRMIPRDQDVDPSVGTFYSFVNPAIPEVKEHTVAVFREVAENYDVDGIHLDYVRYPNEVGDYSYDPVSLERFGKATGATPAEAPRNWIRWRGEQVSEVVRRIHDACSTAAPEAMISAAVGRDPNRARQKLMQPIADWLKEEIVDAATPMIYTTDPSEVARSVSEYLRAADGQLVFAGLMVVDDPRVVLEQIGVARMIGAHGVSLFSYEKLFPDHKPNDVTKALVQGPFQRRAAVPLPPTERDLGVEIEGVMPREHEDPMR